MKKIVFIIVIFTFIAIGGYSEDPVIRIDIDGNKIVSDATIISKIKLRANQPYNESIINDDVKNLYATGFFETVEVEKKDTNEGIVIIFKVKEKPVLKKISLEGQKHIREKMILDAIEIKEGTFIDDYKMKEAARKIKDLYNTKGFSQTEINYNIVSLQGKNEVEAKFIINEKKVLKVRRISILGNVLIRDSRISKVMKTKKAWLLNRGIFKEDVLEDDIRRIVDFYKLQGFSDVKVSPDIKYLPKGIYITISVDEGRRYHIGAIEVKGNKDVSLAEITSAMRLKENSIFSEQAVYEDSSRIREVYMDKGYIFSQIEPFSTFNSKTEKVDVAYTIKENQIAYIEDISIRGNIKTKDKVIRRELRVYPGDRFDGKKVRKSKERLENLGFFEEIRFGSEPGSQADNIDLLVDVKEAKTGYFSFGGGYSSVEELVGFVELRQRNFDYKNFSTFTGAGQDLSLMASIGNLTDQYQLSFTNPWIFDRPISFGFDGYKRGHKQNRETCYAYNDDVMGGALRLGREFTDEVKGGVAYRFERVDISDVLSDATQELRDEAGITDLSSGEFYLDFDTRDNVFSTSRGIYLHNSVQLFGGPFSGDRDFVKYFGGASFFYPLINKSVIEFRLRVGWSDPFSNTKKVPIYERFFVGGADTIRGYNERKVGPVDAKTDEPIGGESMFIGNIEYTYPLMDFLKVATFFDTGEVWKKNTDFLSGDLMSGVGVGLRVKSPIGPVSVDYGWPLDLEPGKESKEGRFHFSVSKEF